MLNSKVSEAQSIYVNEIRQVQLFRQCSLTCVKKVHYGLIAVFIMEKYRDTMFTIFNMISVRSFPFSELSAICSVWVMGMDYQF